MPKTSSLNGIRVLNTRARHQAHALSEAITGAGGIPIELPLLSIKPTDPSWQQTLPELIHVDVAIFVSPNAVHAFFKHISPAVWPASIKIFALGQGTHNALKTYGITPYASPKQADSEHLLMLIQLDLKKYPAQTCLLIKGVGGRVYLQHELTKQGITVYQFDVYQRTLPTPDDNLITSLWYEDAVDIILITSETALKHLFILFDEDKKPWLCNKTCLVISKRLEQAARAKGIKNIIISPYACIIDALIHNKDKQLL
jgi:uroporphyrinogen-III synthase